ncbi:MAG: hypothetical protein KBG15_04900 [Kofleriaceae bacterium]|nr:hypothetical protein [Kofleriaceae bacterium]
MKKIAMAGLLVGVMGAAAGCKGKGQDQATSADPVGRRSPVGSGASANSGAGVGSALPAGSAAVQPASAAAAGSAVAVVDAGPAPADSAAVAQCQRIVDKSRLAIAATLAKHEINIPDFEKNYAGRSQFSELCNKLDEPKRTCVEAAEQPMAAIGSCNVNEGAAPDAIVQAPYVSYDVPAAPLAEGEGAKLLASLVGAWRTEFLGKVTTWTIAPDGKVAINEVAKDGTSKALEYALSFDAAGQVKVRTTPSSTQTYAYFRIDNKTVLLGNNLAYRINPVANVKKFTLKTQGEWIVVDGNACRVITDRGLETAGTCAWGKAGAVKTFKASWDSGRTIKLTGKAIVDSVDYQLLAGHLVDQRLVNIATFKKQ